jgi:hypothetical protein
VQLAVLLGLAVLWIAVLAPDFLRRRSTRRSGDSISNFRHHLSVLERSNPLGQGSRTSLRRRPLPTSVTRAARPVPSNVVPIVPRVTRPRTGAVASTAAPLPAQRSRTAPQIANAAPRRATRGSAHQRRQDVIVTLSAAALLSLLATVAFGGAVLYLHLLIDLLFVGYLGLLLFATGGSRSTASTRAVTYLAPARPRRMAPVAAHERRSTAAR